LFPGGLSSKLLLPPPTVWENFVNTVQGLWTVATDPQKRQAFEDAINDHIIKDDVLKNAPYGGSMTFQLFCNLQSPLWNTRSTTFDAKEFSLAVAPALTNLHEYVLLSHLFYLCVVTSLCYGGMVMVGTILSLTVS
jgi:hypothetical protein